MTKGKITAAIAALIAGAAMFPAYFNPRWYKPTERILTMAELNNLRAGLYTNSVGGASVFKQRHWAYITVGLDESSYIPPSPTVIDTNDFVFYRDDTENLQLVKDAWASDYAWYSAPTIDGDPNGKTNMPIVAKPLDFFLDMNIPTNVFDYTPSRNLSGVGPFTNDVFLGRSHSSINTNTLLGGPIPAGKRANWYGTDYGWDTTWAVMTNMTYRPRCILGRAGLSEPFNAGGTTVTFSNAFIAVGLNTDAFATLTTTNIYTVAAGEILPVYPWTPTFDEIVEAMNDGGSTNFYISFVQSTNGTTAAAHDFGAGNHLGSQGLDGGNYIDGRAGYKWPWRSRKEAWCDLSTRGSSGNPFTDNSQTYNTTAGWLSYTNAAGIHVDHKEDGFIESIYCSVRKVETQMLTFTVNTNSIPAGETLRVKLYAQHCDANQWDQGTAEMDGDGVTARWGSTLETYNLVGTFDACDTNFVFQIITSPESASSSFIDIEDLIAGGYFIEDGYGVFSYTEQVLGAKGYSVDNFGITIQLIE